MRSDGEPLGDVVGHAGTAGPTIRPAFVSFAGLAAMSPLNEPGVPVAHRRYSPDKLLSGRKACARDFNGLKAHGILGRYHPSRDHNADERNPIRTGTFSRLKTDRGWRLRRRARAEDRRLLCRERERRQAGQAGAVPAYRGLAARRHPPRRAGRSPVPPHRGRLGTPQGRTHGAAPARRGAGPANVVDDGNHQRRRIHGAHV
jgi:hypothetical protein